ncbi:FecR family protein [Aquimarina spongiae]|uniref:FecR family protein n=1 Tax=Aquimarina spongiae TaxID=570521 RepID=A0A1M6E004_9FLAO|nr:FecR family protein [Aquimarina spongiae]SHI78854.1 FecR family protein [Aquimarina spongiae]
MSDYKKDNNFLARWLAGEITEEEKKVFEKSKDYLAYKDILNGVERFDQPTFDTIQNLIKQKEYNKTYQEKKTKVISFKPWLYAAAAILLVIVSIRVFNPNQTVVTTEMAQTQTLKLPDNSEVVLNAESSISYEAESFLEKRELTLKGQAYFKVAKGSKFVVKTKNGDIAVLGTQFDVFSRTQKLEVHCFEGKVQVSQQKEQVILTRGKAVKSTPAQKLLLFDIQNQNPSWVNGITHFKEVQLKEVISELERQFDVKIKPGNIDSQRMFTGFFDHQDIKKALQTCFEPMNINYTFTNDNTIELRNK